VRFCAAFSVEDRSTWPQARSILADLLASRNGTTAHTIAALGHAHLDSAWLWPLAESRRKIARTAASQLALLERYPEMRFACSAAQHYAWLQEDHPDLFTRVREAVDDGGWVPVGGSWVEPDCNLPSGESLARQLLHGQRFFERELGRRCREFFNPDVFGLCPQLPQILLGAGIDRVLLQKHDTWSRFTDLPAHSFQWVGLDGSEVLVHTVPYGTYNGAMTVGELRAGAAAYLDADRSSTSMYLFGFGDGGGGPTEEMLERARRLRDLQEVPRVQHATSDEFFERLAGELREPVRVHGELELQAHRGTYTTQAAIKRGVRRCERALQEAEAAAAFAARAGARGAPRDRLQGLWRMLLLHQFHDILPGSSIAEVNAQARTALAAVEREADEIVDDSLLALAGIDGRGESAGALAPINLSPFARREVVLAPGGEAVLVSCPPYGAGDRADTKAPVRATPAEGGGWVLDNDVVQATVGADGSIVGLVQHGGHREALRAPIRLELYDDRPTEFDAWEIDPFDLAATPDVLRGGRAELVADGPLRAEVGVDIAVGARSHLRQTIRLDAEARALEVHVEADWQERHRLLRVRVPTTVHAHVARFETAFGVVERPTHRSRPRDWAQFEVPGHRFAGIEEPGFGVAVLTDSKYGYSAHSADLGVSLLRGPTDPDPQADAGRHVFAYAVLPHAGAWREAGVVAEARRFNHPLRWAAGVAPGHSSAVCDDPHLLLDTVKPAEDGDGTVLRLYDAHGAHGRATIRMMSPPAHSARRTSLLEEPGEPLEVAVDGAIVVPYRPHELVTILVP
jgi:alpha-mannosidase